jgi:hypothetical protein
VNAQLNRAATPAITALPYGILSVADPTVPVEKALQVEMNFVFDSNLCSFNGDIDRALDNALIDQPCCKTDADFSLSHSAHRFLP